MPENVENKKESGEQKGSSKEQGSQGFGERSGQQGGSERGGMTNKGDLGSKSTSATGIKEEEE